MENDILFKKVNFGGFDREDVMNYIAKITDEFHTQLAEKNAQIEQYQNDIVELTDKIAEFESDYSVLSEKCDGLEKRITEVLEEVEKKAEEERDEDETQTLKEAVKALTQKVDELLEEKENQAEENDKLGYDNDLFDLIDQYVD